ncbi:NDR1/HIN1-like protein 13, partial [Phalaenopsis equestris]|uniref:NDR1/HIN1-like protein 13 n=1 Tax=Phalaenopsis equestris TaxID=78828 RepID=UPI0009E23008
PPPPPPPTGATPAAAAGGGGNQPSFPPTKSQQYNRPIYRPQPPAKRRRSRRGCCCACCCWLVLILITLVLLAAVAGGIFYILYQPQRPTFSVSSLQLITLNVSNSNQLTSRLNVAISARNPNKKLVYIYDPISISVTSNGADLGDGSLPGFVQGKKNTTVVRATLKNSVQSVDPSLAAALKKSTVDLEIDLETKAGVKVGGFKTKKMGIRVHCEEIRVNVPKGKKTPPPSTADSSCKVKLRIKIWKWTF